MLKATFLFALSTLAAASPILPCNGQLPFTAPLETVDYLESAGNSSKVNVTLYVMSRCPDARICESVFEDVFKTKGIIDKVQLNLGYIAHSNHSAPLGLDCKHGTLECLGNAHQLCLHRHLPLSDFYAVLSCMNYQTPFPSDIGRISLAKQCAKTVGVDWEKSGVGKCIEGKEGKREGLAKEGYELLRENVQIANKENVTISCTIRIDSRIAKEGSRGCVVDGGVWKGCNDGHAASDFVRVIEEEYKKLQ